MISAIFVILRNLSESIFNVKLIKRQQSRIQLLTLTKGISIHYCAIHEMHLTGNYLCIKTICECKNIFSNYINFTERTPTPAKYGSPIRTFPFFTFSFPPLTTFGWKLEARCSSVLEFFKAPCKLLLV